MSERETLLSPDQAFDHEALRDAWTVWQYNLWLLCKLLEAE